MSVFFSQDLESMLNDRVILLDNDFLVKLFTDPVFFSSFNKSFNKVTLLIDPLIEFEFLRDVFLPQKNKTHKDFLSSEIFVKAPNHQQIFSTLHTNALILSWIYRHQNNKSIPGIVDLFLAARLLYMERNRPILITGNQKDFPSCVFDILGTITSFQDKENQLQTFTALTFSKDKFLKYLKKLENIKERTL